MDITFTGLCPNFRTRELTKALDGVLVRVPPWDFISRCLVKSGWGIFSPSLRWWWEFAVINSTVNAMAGVKIIEVASLFGEHAQHRYSRDAPRLARPLFA